jgi:hypothetical protein
MEEFQEKYGGGIASQDVRSDARKVQQSPELSTFSLLSFLLQLAPSKKVES